MKLNQISPEHRIYAQNNLQPIADASANRPTTITANDFTIVRGSEITDIANWSHQLTDLYTYAWTGNDHVHYLPNPELASNTYWEQEARPRWNDQRMFSWVAVHPQTERIVAHAGVVHRAGDRYELGRLFVNPAEAPRGTISRLFSEATQYLGNEGMYGFIEGVTAHSRSQYMAEQNGWRFAGVDFRGIRTGMPWDVVIYDNAPISNFEPQPGLVGNPRNEAVVATIMHRERLQAIAQRGIATDRRIDLRPDAPFRVLPHIAPVVEKIISQNI